MTRSRRNKIEVTNCESNFRVCSRLQFLLILRERQIAIYLKLRRADRTLNTHVNLQNDFCVGNWLLHSSYPCAKKIKSAHDNSLLRDSTSYRLFRVLWGH